jgi:S-adenosylmethionine-diacylglycerol 3-amino-3-carboxypropyl transferase
MQVERLMDEATRTSSGGETPRRIRRLRGEGDSSWRRRLASHPSAMPGRPALPVLPTLIPTGGEIAYGADFTAVRYAQCWEDADVLLDALAVQPGDVCLSVASAGDNTLALLAKHPAKVFAVDPNPAQLACLELRVAAYRLLEYDDLLVFMGSRRGQHRLQLYAICRRLLSRHARAYWDERPEDLAHGLGSAGKFEHMIARFRTTLVPLAHDRSMIEQLLTSGSRAERQAFFEHSWDTPMRRLLIMLFLPRVVQARTGRSVPFLPSFDLAHGRRLMARTRRLITDLDPAQNPYLHWMFTGTHGTALPFALRRENVPTIRANLDRLDWRLCAVEDALGELSDRSIDRFNLSDTFEYLAEPAFHTLLYRLARCGRRGGRMAYWNTIVRRRRPPIMADMLLPLTELAESLKQLDKVFLYDDFVIEEII